MATSFIFGGDTGETVESLARKRQMADALLARSVARAPRDVGEGLNAVAQALMGVGLQKRVERGEAANAAYNAQLLGGLVGGVGSGGAAPPVAAPSSAPVPSLSEANQTGNAAESFAATAPRLIGDLSKDFDLPADKAAGVVGQLGMESKGLQAINEENPLVPGSRGGFGFAQWTGPRRREFEAFAANNGLEPTSYEAQYGFLKHELQNTPEGRVLDSVRAAPDAVAAGRAFTNGFLRPGIPNYSARDQWTQRALAFAQPSSQQPYQVASLGSAPSPTAGFDPSSMLGDAVSAGRGNAVQEQLGALGYTEDRAERARQYQAVKADPRLAVEASPDRAASQLTGDPSQYVTTAPGKIGGYRDAFADAQQTAQPTIPTYEPMPGQTAGVGAPPGPAAGAPPLPLPPTQTAQAAPEVLPDINVVQDRPPVPMPPVRPPLPQAAPVSLQRSTPMPAPQTAAPQPAPNGAAVMAGFGGGAPVSTAPSLNIFGSGSRSAPAAATPAARVAQVMTAGGPTATDAPAPAASAPVQRVAQAMAGTSPQGLIRIMSDPRASDSVKGVAQLLFKQQLESSDPMKQLQAQKAQLEIENLRNPEAKFITGKDGTIYRQNRNGTLSVAQPGSPDKPNEVREYEYYAQQERSAGREPLPYGDYVIRSKKAGASNVNVDNSSTPKLRQTLDEKQGASWSAQLDAGTASGGAMQDLALLDEIGKQAPQGPLQGRLAQAFPGVNSAADAFQSVISRVAPTLRAPGSGATSDIEYEGMVKSLPSLRNKPEANQAIIGMMRAKADINIKRAEIITRYQNGEITDVEARNALGGLNRQSIMTPELSRLIEATGSGEDKPKAAAPAGPKAGDIVDGYRFKGGDPASQSNWEPVT